MIKFDYKSIVKNSSKRAMMIYFGFTAMFLSVFCSLLGIFVQIKSPDVVIDIIMSCFGASGLCSATVAYEYYANKIKKKEDKEEKEICLEKSEQL